MGELFVRVGSSVDNSSSLKGYEVGDDVSSIDGKGKGKAESFV
jgi:hypothetical protein